MSLKKTDLISQPSFNRFASGQSIFLRSKDNISKIRKAFVEMAQRIAPTHYLTFNFHDDYSMKQAEEKMNRLYADIHYRLHGAYPSKLPENRLMPMVGHPEYTQSGHIHYHVAARISSDRQDWFLRAAPKRWKAIVKTGDLHIRSFDGTEVGLENAAVYSTKSSSHVEWYIPADYRGSAFDADAYAEETSH